MFKNMSFMQSLTSKGMLAGYACIGLGMYVIIKQSNVMGGLELIALGTGIIGVRDAQQS